MPDPLPEHPVIACERRVLQALCQGTPEGSVRDIASRLLANYRWREAIHQVLFNCLVNFRSDTPGAIRDQLPGRMTRRGFPDVDWEVFFEPVSTSMQDAEELMRQLQNPTRASKGAEPS